MRNQAAGAGTALATSISVSHAPAPIEAVEVPLAAPPGVRILVVDDDPRVRRAIANAMARVGFHVFAAEDGAPALELVEHNPPDVALVDFNMPTPGLAVVRQLKAAHGPAIYIAVLSGQDDDETRAACFDAGADDVVAKPANMTELRRRMVAAARTQQAYVEIRLARERADRLLAYGAEAAAMLAHDLNNGLAVALSNMTYLRDAARLEDDDAQALSSAVQALRRMSGLVANFVDIARFEDAAVKPQVTANNVRALLQAVIDVESALPSCSARFEIDCPPELTGMFDLALIERVLHNLVGNAIRYCVEDGVVRLSARAWDPLDPAAVEITVWNTGPLVPEGVRERLFRKYGKGGNGKRGFGLYFCRLACEAHGGSISYRAEPSRGEPCRDDACRREAGPAFSFRLPGRT
jgi:signal transduction histidine kinase